MFQCIHVRFFTRKPFRSFLSTYTLSLHTHTHTHSHTHTTHSHAHTHTQPHTHSHAHTHHTYTYTHTYTLTRTRTTHTTHAHTHTRMHTHTHTHTHARTRAHTHTHSQYTSSQPPSKRLPVRHAKWQRLLCCVSNACQLGSHSVMPVPARSTTETSRPYSATLPKPLGLSSEFQKAMHQYVRY